MRLLAVVGISTGVIVLGEIAELLLPWLWETDYLQGCVVGLVTARLLIWPAEA